MGKATGIKRKERSEKREAKDARERLLEERFSDLAIGLRILNGQREAVLILGSREACIRWRRRMSRGGNLLKKKGEGGAVGGGLDNVRDIL